MATYFYGCWGKRDANNMLFDVSYDILPGVLR